MACTALELHGFCVVVANDGTEGLRRFADHRESIDIVVSDVSMPGMSGPEMVLEMRRERPRLNVLFISGRDDFLPDWIEETCGLLMKPFLVKSRGVGHHVPAGPRSPSQSPHRAARSEWHCKCAYETPWRQLPKSPIVATASVFSTPSPKR
jgi:Response regulator receiver domain